MYVRDNVTDITIPFRAYNSSTHLRGGDRLSLNMEDTTGRIWQQVIVSVVYEGGNMGLVAWVTVPYSAANLPVRLKTFNGPDSSLEATIRFTQEFRASDGASVMRAYCDGEQSVEGVFPNPPQTERRIYAYFINDSGGTGDVNNWTYPETARVGKIISRGAKRNWSTWWEWVGGTTDWGAGFSNYKHTGDVVTDVFGTTPNYGLRVDGDGYIYRAEFAGRTTNFLQLRMRGTTADGDGPHAILDAKGRTKKAYADATKIMFRRIEYFHDAASWSAPVALYTGSAPSAPCLMACDDGTLACWYMDGGTQHASRSSDDGRTWTELSNMLGANLTNVATINVRGTTYGVGVRDNQAYLVRSNDNGQTQTAFPNGATEILIGTVGYDVRCCLTYEDTGEMVCWGQDDDGGRVEFYSRGSGYTTWTRRV